MSGPVDVITEWCPGTPERPLGHGPGYTVEMLITPDQDARWQPGEGQALHYSRHIGEDALGAAPDLRGVLEVICRNVGLATAEVFARELEATIARETGYRPMTPQERFLADRRRAGSSIPPTIRSPLPGGPDNLAPGEREAWASGMVPANPTSCRHCGRRIVYAYPNWVRDDDEPGHDPSQCLRSQDPGHYHEPEASRG